MAAPKYEAAKRGYAHMWDECVVTKPTEAAKVADRIIKNKAAYLDIERRLGIPWIFVGVIHMREGDLNMHTHLHNGDSLQGYTHHVPAGRPKVGHGPPFTWVESAEDALKQKGLQNLKGTWTVELMLFDEEAFNGWGYLSKGNSPYVWSWTNEYHGGKYVADHVYNANVWDPQPGCAAMMKALAAKDESARAWVSRRQVGVPQGAVARATQNERQAGAAGGVAATAGTTSEVATRKPLTEAGGVTYHMIHGTIIVIGAAVAVVALVNIYKKSKAIRERFLGTTATRELEPPAPPPPPPPDPPPVPVVPVPVPATGVQSNV